jgi:broad specificity polyphosphatase/5'/3'-nucleotidase SurE
MDNRNHDRFRSHIRKLVKKQLEEMTTTGMVGGYLTPGAFRGNDTRNVNKVKQTSTDSTGFELTPQGKQDLERPADKLKESLSENKYYAYKKDPTKSPHKKIAEAISLLNKTLHEVESTLKMNSRLKLESGIASEQLWKRTQQGLVKLESRLLNIATKIREIRGQ